MSKVQSFDLSLNQPNVSTDFQSSCHFRVSVLYHYDETESDSHKNAGLIIVNACRFSPQETQVLWNVDHEK